MANYPAEGDRIMLTVRIAKMCIRDSQYSANRSYFSWLCGNKEYTLDARIKGGERHMRCV